MDVRYRDLREDNDYTQKDIAKMIGVKTSTYSTWERCISDMPLEKCNELANIYGVTLDYLTHEVTYKYKKEYLQKEKKYSRNKIIITLLSVIIAWFVAILGFVSLLIYSKIAFWPLFIWPIPVTFLLLLIFNCIWGKKPLRFFYISCLIWTLITAIFLQFIYLDINIWPLFLIGIPSQVATILWSGIKRK